VLINGGSGLNVLFTKTLKKMKLDITGIFVHELHAPSIPEPAPTTTGPAPSQPGQEVLMIDMNWQQSFIDYIHEQKVPLDKNMAG
jgi:hypothetical protein